MPEVKNETTAFPPEATTKSSLPPAADFFSLAHLSDLHLTSLSNARFHQLLNKRILGYLSWWRKRRFVHRRDIVDALVDDLKTTQPDHVAVTGDLTHIGLPDEFSEAGQWLTGLGNPDQVTVIPGNHEAYSGIKWFKNLPAWAPYLHSDNSPERPLTADFFPSLRIRGQIALIGLCSAKPSLPFLATGGLGRKQLAELATLLQETGEQGLLRIVLVHHPPVTGTIKWRKRLVDGRELTEVLVRHGAELVLHGHAHYALYSELSTVNGTVPVIGAASGSELKPQSGRSAKYNLYGLKRNGRSWELSMSVRAYSETSGRFVEEQKVSLPLPPAGPAPMEKASGKAC